MIEAARARGRVPLRFCGLCGTSCRPREGDATVVYVATKNLGKLRELQAIFGRAGWKLATYPDYLDVVEGDDSYVANAALKARALQGQLRVAGIAAAVLADDSGLEVAALGGRPGIHSARYGGEGASWAQRREMLLAETAAASESDRRARFVCALYYIAVDGRETHVVAYCDGMLASSERGVAGFSYDPIFVSLEHGRTFAELSEEEKDRISHRARAASALLVALSERPEIAPAEGKTKRAGT